MIALPSPHSVAARVAVFTLAWVALCGFRPFSQVTTVCPACPEKGDRLVLPDGKVLVADVIGKNQDGWIVQKYGEVRFIQTKELAKIEWQAGAEPRGLDGHDQILLKGDDQKILHGVIIQLEPGKPVAMRGPKGNVYTVLPAQMLLFYQRGVRKAPPKDAGSAT